jgi:SAM-dependent methyltransferase
MESKYICPDTKKPLTEVDGGLAGDRGHFYKFVRGWNNIPIPNFLSSNLGASEEKAIEEYDRAASISKYRNFLDWLFQTFAEDEVSFRRRLVQKLHLAKGSRVLITGCGMGDDIPSVLEAVGSDGEVFAQDISTTMIVAASEAILRDHPASRIGFSIGDATKLPFAENFFDAAFHFGGINLFSDVAVAIAEMNRVVKSGGRVVFGDEGIAPWLKGTEYGRIAITNNPLWAADAPIAFLPASAADAALFWVLGNCFYVVSFQVSNELPHINIDVPHKGTRGGSMRTRYFGQLEGVTEDSKRFVLEDAKRLGISVHAWLESAIRERRQRTS